MKRFLSTASVTMLGLPGAGQMIFHLPFTSVVAADIVVASARIARIKTNVRFIFLLFVVADSLTDREARQTVRGEVLVLHSQLLALPERVVVEVLSQLGGLALRLRLEASALHAALRLVLFCYH